MKIGLIREEKKPFDRRVVLSPSQCKELSSNDNVRIFVQPSPHRCFSDNDYRDNGCVIQEDMQECDILLGVKEVPVNCLIKNQTYMFFSHTIKKQEYNRELLKKLISNNITMIDYEALKSHGERLIGFGRFAGIVGAYNAFFAHGLKSNNFNIKRAYACQTLNLLYKELDKVILFNEKIILTGKGKVAKGAREILDYLKIKEVNKDDFLNKNFNFPVYCNLDIQDYYERKDAGDFDKLEFYNSPILYKCKMRKFIKKSNIFIAGHFHNSQAGVILEKKDFLETDLKVVSDISCDIGVLACTTRESTITEPIYGYDAKNGVEVDYNLDSSISVLAVSNLPCEIPIESSIDFGRNFIDLVFPLILDNDQDLINAIICENQSLTSRFSYLSDFAL